jgi:hypothetical protein
MSNLVLLEDDMLDALEDLRIRLAVCAARIKTSYDLDPEDVEERSVYKESKLQLWGYLMTFVCIFGLGTAIFHGKGPMAQSLASLVFVLSLIHSVLLFWIRPIVLQVLPEEIDDWFDGHLKNYVWGVVFSLVTLLFV